MEDYEKLSEDDKIEVSGLIADLVQELSIDYSLSRSTIIQLIDLS